MALAKIEEVAASTAAAILALAGQADADANANTKDTPNEEAA